MMARWVPVALILTTMVGGLTTGRLGGADTQCPDVYTEFLRQAGVEASFKAGTAVVDDAIAGFDESVAPGEAATAARTARLQLVVDNTRCFTPGDVFRARTGLRADQVREGG